MSLNEAEAVASLRVLVSVAKADGVLHDAERKALAAALEGMDLPGDTSVESMLDAAIDLDAELARLATDEARTEAYRSAYGLAYADGDCSPEEAALLERIRGALGVPEEQRAALEQLFARAREGAPAEAAHAVKPIADPAERAARIRSDVLKSAVYGAVLGAFPVPGLAIASDLAIVALQVGLVRDIGRYYGQVVDKNSARALLYTLGVGTGAWIAVSNLAKLVPGWGSAVGAAGSFTTTYAIGRVMDSYFAKAGQADVEELKKEFKAGQKEGKKAYGEMKEEIAAKAEANKAALTALNEELKAGRITHEELARRAAELG